MQEAEIGFSCADPVLHQRVFFYFRKGSPYGTSWGNWSDALDTIAGYVASEFTDQALNFSVKSLIKGSTVGGSGKLIGLPEFVDSVGGTGAWCHFRAVPNFQYQWKSKSYVLYCTVPNSIISVQWNIAVNNAIILESAVRGIDALELLFLLIVGIEVAFHFSFSNSVAFRQA